MNIQPVSFDKVAPVYDSLASLVYGKAIRKAQQCFLSSLQFHDNVLIIGGGSGWILKDLLLQSKVKHISYLEASSKMLQSAHRQYRQLKIKFPNSARVDFFHGSIEALPVHRQYNAVLTFFLFDLYSQADAQQLANGIDQRLEKNALWLFADFEVQPYRWSRWWQQLLLQLMLHFFRFTTPLRIETLPNYDHLLANCGWRRQQSAYFYGRFIRSTVYQK